MEYSTYSEMDCDLDGRCRDMFWEFVYIVVIPGAVLFTIVFITSILMCCNTCKRKKSDILTDETQLLQYNSIRRASLNLRHLSRNRDTPLLSARADREYRTASLNMDGEQRYRRTGHATSSAPGTLQRDRDRRQRHQMTRRSLTDVLQAAADGLQTSTEYKESVPTSEQQQESGRKQSQSSMQAQGSGVEYAELNHEAMTASTSAGSPSERLIQ
ncbi:uncharacterized protein LOC128212114 [Mya arenaria]|uniref:uncharacterized protein LOC128211459 n=1 Tax=Mya arenaria TaxID=6604 RepID=UPI0022E0F3D6|nr:uncharacterized protein LOC128211459 [Mya arenaria]XP_052773357.1 uncharacterized protein LOC128212114 [Mya arenaria]